MEKEVVEGVVMEEIIFCLGCTQETDSLSLSLSLSLNNGCDWAKSPLLRIKKTFK